MATPTLTPEQLRTLNSKDWQLPDAAPTPLAPPTQHTAHAFRPTLPTGTYYKININYHIGEREFDETHYLCLTDGLQMNQHFQSYFLRYWWDPQDGSPPEDDGYAYSDDLWVSDSFENYVEVPADVMRAMFNANLTGPPMIYGRDTYNTWTEGRQRYREYHDLEDDWDE